MDSNDDSTIFNSNSFNLKKDSNEGSNTRQSNSFSFRLFHSDPDPVKKRSSSIFPSVEEKVLSQLYPPYIKLHLVQVIHRHGHRTPLRYRLPGLLPLTWPRCYSTDQTYTQIYHPAAIDHKTDINKDLDFFEQKLQSEASLIIKMPSHIFKFNVENPAAPPHLLQEPLAKPSYSPGQCYYGQLTDTGKELLTTFGQNLRNLYVHKLGFLPASWPSSFSSSSSNVIYLRSTDYPRTIESLQSLLFGFYPPNNLSSQPNIPIPIHIRKEDAETMYPWSKCIRYRELQNQFKKAAHNLLAKDIECIKLKLKHLFSLSDAFGAYPSYHGLYDTLVCRKAHGMDIKKKLGVRKRDLKTLELISSREWFTGFEQSQEVVRLGIGRFIKELKESIENKYGHLNPRADTASAPPTSTQMKDTLMMIYSGHDSTIAPLLCAFQVYDDKWPSFGSNVTLELLEDIRLKDENSSDPSIISSNHDRFFVRIKSNDQVFQLPGCLGYYHDTDSSLCQVKKFLEICDTFIPKNLDRECALVPDVESIQ